MNKVNTLFWERKNRISLYSGWTSGLLTWGMRDVADFVPDEGQVY